MKRPDLSACSTEVQEYVEYLERYNADLEADMSHFMTSACHRNLRLTIDGGSAALARAEELLSSHNIVLAEE